MIDAVIYINTNDVNTAQSALENALQYARDQLNAAIGHDLEAKTIRKLREGEPAVHIRIADDARAWICLSHPGVRDDRSKTGGEYCTDQITDDSAKHLILPTLERVAAEGINTAVENRCKVHCVNENLTISPDDGGLQVLAIDAVEAMCDSGTAELDLVDRQWQGGRPPIGCEVESNRLVKGDDYDTVRETLQDVRTGDTTKTAAADRLGCTRRTITNAMVRESLYQLD